MYTRGAPALAGDHSLTTGAHMQRVPPPSTFTISPVTKLARSEQRKRTTAATSSDVPMRPSGTLPMARPSYCSAVTSRVATLNCARYQDTRWVCEEHPDKPMGHDGSKGAGRPVSGLQSAARRQGADPAARLQRLIAPGAAVLAGARDRRRARGLTAACHIHVGRPRRKPSQSPAEVFLNRNCRRCLPTRKRGTVRHLYRSTAGLPFPSSAK